MPQAVFDRYLTDERWEHLIEFHEEMRGYRDHLLATLRRGRRRQDPLDPTVYSFIHPFEDLEHGYTHVVVIVKFSVRETSQGIVRNNFVLTAYQKTFYGRSAG